MIRSCGHMTCTEHVCTVNLKFIGCCFNSGITSSLLKYHAQNEVKSFSIWVKLSGDSCYTFGFITVLKNIDFENIML